MLLLRPDHIGDVLLTSPAVALLRESLPSAHLTYLVGPWSAEAAGGGPRVDTLRTLRYPGFTRRTNPNLLGPYALLMRESARLRRERYDLAVVFRPDHWWGVLLTLLAGIPVRVGGRTPETTPLLTHVRATAPGEHTARTALELARLGLDAFNVPAVDVSTRPSFQVTEVHRQTALDFWTRYALDSRPVVAVAPSAGAALKAWPIQRWASLANGLIARGTAVLLVGGPDDGALLAAIQARVSPAPAVTASGQSLGISAALFERCALLVGLDGGQAHLAAAVGTPTVRLYGPASSETFGPWPPQEQQRVLITRGLSCVPCGHLEGPPCGATTLPACLLALGVEDVLHAVSAQLDGL
ncbi:MAG: glycosyltransferase family 9 protein [Chloroflexota bacterium]|nr:glycosyltransferase family 9 protein [Chloroflexota bacterium]